MSIKQPNGNRRYELIPQMQAYDQLRSSWVPHLMYVNEPDFRSDVCNTDEHGFRLTHKNDEVLDFQKFQQTTGRKAVLCGASTVFGTGATSDSATMPSVLNRDSDTTWFNFGGMAHTSTQELLMYLLFRPKSECVVLFSGINNLAIHAWSPYFSEVYGSIFNQSLFQILNRIDGHGQYLKYLSTRLLDRFVRRLRGLVPFIPQDSDMVLSADLDMRYQSSIEILARDLDVWVMLRDQLGFSLTFVLQPISVWMSKNLCPQEQELIGQLDESGRRQWGESGGELQRYMSDSYPRYRSDTQQLCERRGIKWVDCNQMLPDEGWLFVDRTHLTDYGQELAAEVIKSECDGSP